MLRLPEFGYIRPRTLKEATKVLADLGPEAMVVAGGTDVYPKMKRGQFTPRHLVAPGSDKCLAISSSDTAPVLVSLGAEAVLVGKQGERRVRLGELYRDDGIDYLGKGVDEVLKGLLIPEEALGWRNAYLKLPRLASFYF